MRSQWAALSLSSTVSSCHPLHSPTKAIVISSGSEQRGAGPGRRQSGPIRCQQSSTSTYTHRQKSSNVHGQVGAVSGTTAGGLLPAERQVAPPSYPIEDLFATRPN